MRVIAPLVVVCLLACSGTSQSDGGAGGASATGGGSVSGGGTAMGGGTVAGGGSAGGTATDGGNPLADGGRVTVVDAGRWPVSFAANEAVTTMVALDSGDLIVALLDVISNERAVLRLAIDGTVTWRYPMGMRAPLVIDVSRSDRIIVFANSQGMFQIVVLNPDGTLRRELPGDGRGFGRFDRNEVVWSREWRLDDTGTFTASTLSADRMWPAGSFYDVDDFIVALGGPSATSTSMRAIELDGGVRWNLPVTFPGVTAFPASYGVTLKLGSRGSVYAWMTSQSGDGGILALDVGCGVVGRFSLSAIDQGVCRWSHSWDPGRVLTAGEVSAFEPTPEGVVSWNGSTLDLFDARDGGTLRTFVDGGVLRIAASRFSQTVYYQDDPRRLQRAR